MSPTSNEGSNIRRLPQTKANNEFGNDGGEPPQMNERLAKLEGAFEGLKIAIEGLRHTQNMTIGVVLGVGAILATLGIYILQRIDALPNEFQGLTNTLSNAITAAKQQPPQIILMPTPPQPPQQIPPNNQK